MKNKWLFLALLILAEVLIMAGIVFVVWQGISQTNIRGLSIGVRNPNLFSAESEEEWQFDAGEITEVLVDSDGGDAIVRAAASDTFVVTAHKTAWSSTKARAQSNLDDLSITVTQKGNKIIIKYKKQPKVRFVGQQQIDTVDFIIATPEDTIIYAQTDFGDINLTGKVGDVELSTDFGNLVLSGSSGNVQAISRSGDISVEKAGGEDPQIFLHSDFGDVSLERSDCASVKAHSNSGSVILNDVDALEKIDLSSDFGKLEFNKGSTEDLLMDTKSGKVLISGVKVQNNISVRNGFGDLSLENTSAKTFDLDTNSGKIELSTTGGSIKAVSDFGDLDISSTTPANLNLHTESGNIEYSGPLGIGPHSLVTDFGDIVLYLPRDTAITVDLETDFGKLNTEFPITLDGDVKQDHWIGTINEGGAEVIANTNSGNISFKLQYR